MLIRDVVTQNSRASFANDVQLAWYPAHERNLHLVQMYTFTDRAVQGKVSSIGILERVRQCLLDGVENRFVIRATYGHGKTHFALALANYFGQPFDSEEVQSVLKNIAHPISPDRAQNFVDFRKRREAFLVVRLRGDLPQGLHQQFIRGLEQAIEENPKTRGARLPFWFENATTFLNSLTGEEQDRAAPLLAPHQLVLTELRQMVEQREPRAHDLCYDLHRQLRGFPPNFGGEVSLQSVVEWAVDELCSGSAPKAGGLVVLFDEFTAFVRRYAQVRDAANDTSLQDLLNGIGGKQGRSIFVAFAHEEPENTLENVLRLVPNALKQDLNKELTRLPKSHRMQLYSSMETVLAAYLKQDAAAMDTILEKAATPFADATDDTMQLFKPRYEQSQGWGLELFDEIVTQGCFPLHPLTTGLFSNVNFAETESQRSVLNFVLTEFAAKQDQEVLVDGKPNWIYSNRLVEWFGGMLGEEYPAYEAARKQLGGDITPLQLDVLQAVLLFQVGQLRSEGVPFQRIVAHMSGCEAKACRAELESLQVRGLLRHDAIRGTYGFWPAGGGAFPVEEMLRREAGKRQLDWPTLDQINRDWRSAGRLALQENDMGGGHPLDWAAREVLLTRPHFAADIIRRVAPLFRVNAKQGVEDGVRGAVIRLVAETEDDVEFFQQNAELILDSALEKDPLPVIVAVPVEPRPLLLRGIQRELTLRDLPAQRRKDLGADACATVEQNNKKALDEELARLREYAVYAAPQPFRAAIRERNWQEDERNVRRLSYGMAYPHNPKSFFTQYKLDTPNLRKAVSVVAQHLVENRVAAGWGQIQANRVAMELVNKFLQVGGQGSWGLLSVTRAVQVPQAQRVREAWDLLEKTFAPGTKDVPVKDALLALLNPPYGYDYNQLTLLFCAWYAHRAHELQVTNPQGYRASIPDMLSKLDLPGKFIGKLCFTENVRLSRVDATAEETQIRLLIDRTQKESFSLAGATGDIAKLHEYARRERSNPELKKAAGAAAESLQADLDRAKEYLEAVQQIEDRLPAASNLDKLLPVHELIQKLPKLGRVTEDSWPKQARLKSQFDETLRKVVETECTRLETLREITQHGLAKERLTATKSRVERVGLMDATDRVATALERLEVARERLEQEGQEQGLLTEVRHMQVKHGLVELRQYLGRLQGMTPRSDKAKAAVEAKRSEIAAEVERLTAWPSTLERKLAEITSLTGVRDLRDDIRRRQYRFEGAPETAQLESALESLGKLEAVLQQLETVRQRPIQTPNDLEEGLQALVSAREGLREAQTALLDAEAAKLRNRGEVKEREAKEWLEHLQRDERAGKNVGDLLRRATGGHPFLGEEARAHLREFVAGLEERQRAAERERELQQKEASIREQIHAISTKGGLQDLRNGLDTLAGFAPESQETRNLLGNKRQQFQTAIEKRLSDLESFRGRAAGAHTPGAAQALETDLVRSLDAYEGTPEGEQLAQLLEGVREKLRVAREREVQQKALRQSIRSIESQAPITKLRESQSYLGGVETDDPEAQRLVQQKLKEIEDSIARTQNRLTAAGEALARVASVDQVRKVRQDLLGQVSRWEGSPEGSRLQELLARCDHLEQLFEQLRQVEATRVDTPATHLRLVEAVSGLRATEDGALTPDQAAVFDAVLQKLEAARAKQIADVAHWLSDCRRSAENGGDLHQVLTKLDQPPAFLMEEQRPELVALQADIKSRLDRDALLAVTTHFRRIGDPAKRAECLRALQELARELEAS